MYNTLSLESVEIDGRWQALFASIAHAFGHCHWPFRLRGLGENGRHCKPRGLGQGTMVTTISSFIIAGAYSVGVANASLCLRRISNYD